VSLGREPADLVWRRGLDLRVAHCCHEHAGSIFGFLTLELLRVDAELQATCGNVELDDVAYGLALPQPGPGRPRVRPVTTGYGYETVDTLGKVNTMLGL
jgi:hypothetical protein